MAAQGRSGGGRPFGADPVWPGPPLRVEGETLQKIQSLKESMAVKKALVGKSAGLKGLLEDAKRTHGEALKFYFHDFTDPESLQLKLQKEMEKLSASFNVKIVSTEWLYPSKEDVVQAPIKIVCEAPIDSIIRLIAAIETDKKFLSIDRLQISSRPAAVFVWAEMGISAYGIKDGK